MTTVGVKGLKTYRHKTGRKVRWTDEARKFHRQILV